MTADAPVGFPCRVLLADASPGDTLLLLNHEYQPTDTPYRGRHAIFVNEAATAPARFENQVPAVLSVRKHLSLRAFDAADMMIDADVVSGAEVEALIQRLFGNPQVRYIHAHNAGRDVLRPASTVRRRENQRAKGTAPGRRSSTPSPRPRREGRKPLRLCRWPSPG